eukprot:TRINITY_DN6269_c0_g1_i1.p1 TRINITY_DN6269_c0_g1~~TRINITY_DN6269_c0_g1_i1.p1  ORF type:complete len:422 (+),score=77.07 TRINITY_DN6269_c0_g1_i1:30-1268(+)
MADAQFYDFRVSIFTNTEQQSRALIERVSEAMRIFGRYDGISPGEIRMVNVAQNYTLQQWVRNGLKPDNKDYPISFLDTSRIGTLKDLKDLAATGKLKSLIDCEAFESFSGSITFSEKSLDGDRTYDQMCTVEVIHPWKGSEPQQHPNLQVGDIIYVHTSSPGVPPAASDPWWWGEKKGDVGADKVYYFPSSYTKLISKGEVTCVVPPRIQDDDSDQSEEDEDIELSSQLHDSIDLDSFASDEPGKKLRQSVEQNDCPPPGAVSTWMSGADWLLSYWYGSNTTETTETTETNETNETPQTKVEVDEEEQDELDKEANVFSVIRTNWMWRNQNRVFKLEKTKFMRLTEDKTSVRAEFEYKDVASLVVQEAHIFLIIKFLENKYEEQHLYFPDVDSLNNFADIFEKMGISVIRS